MASVYSNISTVDEEFPEITQEQQTFISRAFTNLTSLLGSYVNHRWYVNFTNLLYNGHVVISFSIVEYHFHRPQTLNHQLNSSRAFQ